MIVNNTIIIIIYTFFIFYFMIFIYIFLLNVKCKIGWECERWEFNNVERGVGGQAGSVRENLEGKLKMGNGEVPAVTGLCCG